MMLLISILIGQISIISCYFGIWNLPIILIGTIFGFIVGIVLYICYFECNLVLQDLNKIDVKGKCVLITGCDSGFGFNLAKSLSKRGMFVFAGVLNLKSEGSESLKGSSHIKLIQMNVTDENEIQEGLRVVENHLSDTNTILWSVVNNAGIANLRILEFMPIDQVFQIMNVNSLGMLRVCQHFARLLRGHGRIVNVTSIAGFVACPFSGAYCASKFAAEAISQTMRIEMEPFEIAVITIQPGAYKTNIMASLEKYYESPETDVYGGNQLQETEKIMKKLCKSASENIHEVIDAMESGILNKKFQLNYNPGFLTRIYVLCFKLVQVLLGKPFQFVSLRLTQQK